MNTSDPSSPPPSNPDPPPPSRSDDEVGGPIPPIPDIRDAGEIPEIPEAEASTPPSPGATVPPLAPASSRPDGDSAASTRAREIDAGLQAEIDAALADMSVDEMLDSAGPATRVGSTAPGLRTTRTGRIVRVHNGEVFVEFGPKSQGVCPASQFDEPPSVGASVEFVVERLDAFESLLILSLPGAVQKADWGSLAIGQVVEARCVGMNKGGLEMEVAHHRGFMPAGQVDVRSVPDISVFLGEKFPCKIIELKKEKNRLVLSRKAVVLEEREEAKTRLLDELEVGQVRRAVVVGVQPYGAFADLGGLDGLIPVGELAHERIRHASDVVNVGDAVEVKVVSVDREKSPPRVSLSRKQVLANPAAEAMEKIEQGQTVSGRVTRITDFGAFIELAPNLEGLVHISEVSHARIPSVAKVLSKDQVVQVKVLSVDADRGRIGLSIKALEDRPAPAKGDRGGPAEEPAREEDPALRKMRAKRGAKAPTRGGMDAHGALGTDKIDWNF
jgi:ribosomal protein S1